MRLFRRKRDENPVGPNERSPRSGVRYEDLRVIDQLVNAGADISEARHVVYYFFAPSETAAHAIARVAETEGFSADVERPLPELPGRWTVTCETHAVLSPDFVRQTDDFFRDLAARQDAEYDGWEASI